jgi:ssDNA-binding Zn-finger/Zn-ribbon topoisomerase 1
MNVTQTNQKLPYKEPLTLNDSCPLCGGYLIARKNRYNTRFLGCIHYPVCVFTTTEKTVNVK